MKTCTICNGTTKVTQIRKTLGGDRLMKVTCTNCYGSGKELELFYHHDLTIIKRDENHFEIIEMKCEVTSLDHAKKIIDNEYKNYELLQEECSFEDYIEECLGNDYDNF